MDETKLSFTQGVGVFQTNVLFCTDAQRIINRCSLFGTIKNVQVDYKHFVVFIMF